MKKTFFNIIKVISIPFTFFLSEKTDKKGDSDAITISRPGQNTTVEDFEIAAFHQQA